MCGICGIIDTKNHLNTVDVIQTMMRSIKHRGPDDEGHFIASNIALGHVRLSIIDLSGGGKQPMFSADKDLVVVFNGEIYNYLSLKEELKDKYVFKTSSDTEVILYAYQEWGEDCLLKFNGMFAFAICDKKKNRLFAARDRFGIKPFYYYSDQNKFIFCSEIKGILSTNILNATLNEEALYDFVVFNRTDHSEYTCFKDIYTLRPGHLIDINLEKNEANIKQWYFLPEVAESDLEFEKAEGELFDKLLESIRLHLVSDVPVGSALSGGIDSSTIVCLMKELLPKESQISSFSAVYDTHWEKDETKYINEIVTQKNLKSHFVHPNAEGLLSEIENIIYFQEEPFASASMYASWKVYEESNRRNIKVLLNGQGADEIFAYDYMAAFYFKQLFIKFRWIKLLKEIFLFHKKQYSSKFCLRLFAFLIAPDFLKSRLIRISDRLVNKNFFEKYKSSSNFNKTFFNSDTLNENVRNHLLMKLHHLLRIEDKNSMRFSVEARVPFLENQLVEYALNIPASYKIYNGEIKYILKQTMRKLLPPLIFQRNTKIGFETPMDSWFRTDIFKLEFDKMLSESDQVMQKYLNIDIVKKKWEEHKAGKNNGRILWKYFYLTKWYKQFFGNLPNE